MKKLMVLLRTSFGIMAAAMPVCANTITQGGYTWTYVICSGGGVRLENRVGAGWSCAISPQPEGGLEIPAVLSGRPVVEIGDFAFNSCRSLTSVTIPTSVTSIGDNAFSYCSRLTSIAMPASITNIVSHAFSGCYYLSHVVLPNNIGPIAVDYHSFEDTTQVRVADKSGYLLMGWTNNMGVVVANPFHPSTPQTVSPYWRRSVIQFDPNGGDGEILTQNITDYPRLRLNKNLFVRNGWVFSGWALSRNGIGRFQDEQLIENLPDELGAVDCLYAVWKCREVIDGIAWTFSVSDDGRATIENDGRVAITPVPIGDFLIPEEIGGYPVTGIGSHAFAGCETLTSITIPSNVASIGYGAFEGCTGLTNVVIEAESIDFMIPGLIQAKYDTRFDITSTLNDADDAANVSGVIAAYTHVEESPWKITDPLTGKEYVWNEANTTFAYFGQMYMEAGKTYVFGVHFDDDAYVKIDGNTLVNVWNAAAKPVLQYATGIGYTSNEIFQESYSCVSSGWREIDIRLSDCTGGKGSWSNIWSADFGAGYRDDGNTDTSQIGWKRLLDPGDGSLFRSSGMRTVFAGCSNIVSVTMPWALVSRMSSMFPDAYNKLESITLTGEADMIPAKAFAGCASLRSLEIPDSVTNVGYYAFHDCRHLTNMFVPNSVTNIGRGIFSGCSGLMRLTIPFVGSERGNSLAEEAVFGHIFGESNANGLICTTQCYDTDKNVTRYIPASLIEVNVTDETIVAQGAFDNCMSLTNLSFNMGVENVGKYACSHCKGLVNMIVPDGVLNIGDEAFIDCTGLVSISFPSSLSRIGLSMCSGNGALTTVTFSEGLQEIYDYAFDGCGSLTNVVIPSGVTRIGYRAFRNCGNLRTLTIPASVNYMGYQAFKSCSSLEKIHIHSIESWCGIRFGSQAGNPMCDSMALLYINDVPIIDLVIPDGITQINNNAFIGARGIHSVSIPDSVISVGNHSFEMWDLCNVRIPQYVCDSTLATTFQPCYNVITNVVLTDSVKKIRTTTFSGCSGIVSVTIPSDLVEIGDRAFVDCVQLMKVELPSDIGTLSIGVQAFNVGTIVNVIGRDGYRLCWTNATGEVVTDPFHSPTAVTVSPWWRLPQVAAPIIEPQISTSFANASQEVSISCGDADAKILFTIDGSDPVINGNEYTQPFLVYESCRVRAIARNPPLCDSDEVTVELTRTEGLSEVVNLYGYLMETDTSNPWTVVTDVSHDGVSCARSGAIGHGGMTWLQTSMRKAGRVSFWWKAACEEAEEEDGETYWYDYGSFLVDGVEKANIAGNDTGWRKVEVDVPTGGKHVLRWEYRKDDATSYSPDCIWLDQVQWIPADGSGYTLTTPEPVPYSWLTGYNLGLDSDFESAAKQATGKVDANGRSMAVWQDYVVGTDPTNPNDLLRAVIAMSNDAPVVTWTPNLNTNGEVRVYTVLGKTNLTDAAWTCPTNAAHRFFKVKVEMP